MSGTYKPSDLNTKPVHACDFGNTSVFDGTLTPADLALNTVLRFCKIPAGTRVTEVGIGTLVDIDSGTSACKLGYSYCDGSAAPSGADTAFGSALAWLQAAGRNWANFEPFTIEKDAYLDLVITTGGTYQNSGNVHAIVYGSNRGPK